MVSPSVEDIKKIRPTGNQILLFLDLMMLLRAQGEFRASPDFNPARLHYNKLTRILTRNYDLNTSDFSWLLHWKEIGDERRQLKMWDIDLTTRSLLRRNISVLGNIRLDTATLWEDGVLGRFSELLLSESRQCKAIAEAVLLLYAHIMTGELKEEDFKDLE